MPHPAGGKTAWPFKSNQEALGFLTGPQGHPRGMILRVTSARLGLFILAAVLPCQSCACPPLSLSSGLKGKESPDVLLQVSLSLHLHPERDPARCQPDGTPVGCVFIPSSDGLGQLQGLLLCRKRERSWVANSPSALTATRQWDEP